MKLNNWIAAAALLVAPAAMADGDSSSDAGNGFIQTLNENEALMIAVPVNEAGEELVAEAESRLVRNILDNGTDLATAFESGIPVDTDRGVTDFDVTADSSTSGWYYGGHSYGDYRHHRSSYSYYPQYYHSYSPSYYHHGSYYNYCQPTYRSYYGHHGHWNYGHHYSGYRYYHYQRGWH